MPSDRTMVTELGTALGMLGIRHGGRGAAVALGRDAQPLPRMLGHTCSTCAREDAFDAEFHAAWENGRAFLAADGRPARAGDRGSSSGRGPGGRRATRWRRSTCGWTTST